MDPFFANMSCDPFTARDAQCVVGSYVQYAVNASTIDCFEATVAFVQRHNIRLVIRNTGHDYLGKSTGAGAVALWTHHIKNMSVQDYESPTYTGKAMKLGAGVMNLEAQEAAHVHGLLIVGGDCQSVGLAGGYTQGGGHGPLSSTYGLGADQVLEYEVLTGTGKYLKATPHENSDLYWALSGGGGGTYGIVFSITVKAYPDVKSATANLTFSRQGISSRAFDIAVQRFLTSLPSITDSGATCIWLLTNTSFTLSPASGPNMTSQQLHTLLQPTLESLSENGISYDYSIKDSPNYLESYNTLHPKYNITEASIGGRLIPRSIVASNSSTISLMDAMKFIISNGGQVSGVSINVTRPPDVPNSVNPAWRSTLFSAVVSIPYDALNYVTDIVAQERITNMFIPKLAELTPGGSAYLNEADPHQPDFERVFYGENYERLLDIKQKTMSFPSEAIHPQARCLAEAGLREQILLPSDPRYKAREATYWSRSASLNPVCIVRPRNATDVSTALKALVSAGRNFAIRSGGHAPSAGVNNIEDGITIDLSLINHIIYDAASQTVEIGPGQSWKEVYKELQKSNRAVAGSRDGHVGVAGFLLGGGYSWITGRTGWGCDNVLAYEVVLADGRIVAVSAKEDQHPDMFLALKGGGNNFGIVTSFTMSTVHCARVWGGKAIAPKTAMPDVIRIASRFPETVSKHPDCNLVIVITYVPEKDDIVASAAIVQTQGDADDPGLSEWMALPMILNTTKVTTIYDTTFDNAWFTACFKNDERIVAKAVAVHADLVETFKLRIPESDFRTQCIFQPVPKMIAELSIAGGGNVMGVEHHTSNGILFLLSAMLKTSEQKAFAQVKVHQAVEAVREYAATIEGDGNLPWIYMNYADKSQNVLGSYGIPEVMPGNGFCDWKHDLAFPINKVFLVLSYPLLHAFSA
ncbi:hypothetical protein ABKA04_009942 [Annulohypoxylon sp. FPYF3050]